MFITLHSTFIAILQHRRSTLSLSQSAAGMCKNNSCICWLQPCFVSVCVPGLARLGPTMSPCAAPSSIVSAAIQILAPTVTARISLGLPCFSETAWHVPCTCGPGRALSGLPWRAWLAAQGPIKNNSFLFSSRALISLHPGSNSDNRQHFSAVLSSITPSRDYHHRHTLHQTTHRINIDITA